MKPLPGEAMDLAEAWVQWRDVVPPEERQVVARLVGDADLSTKSGINLMCQAVMVEVFRGTVSPVVLTAAKPWLELIIYNLDSERVSAGLKPSAHDSLAVVAGLMKQFQPAQPTYQIVENTPEAVERKFSGR